MGFQLIFSTMWAELICGLVIFQLLQRFFSDDDALEIENTDSGALFSVANK